MKPSAKGIGNEAELYLTQGKDLLWEGQEQGAPTTPKQASPSPESFQDVLSRSMSRETMAWRKSFHIQQKASSFTKKELWKMQN